MGVRGHPSREQTLIFVIGCFIKPSGCVGAAARQPSRLGTNKVPSRSRIYDRRPFSHQKEILLANKGESIYDNGREDGGNMVARYFHVGLNEEGKMDS